VARAGYKDYYAILGVSKTASDKEIRQAYRKLARELHPDVNPDKKAQERFKDVNEAYEVLSDAEKRKKYDRFGSAGGASVDFDDLFGGGRPRTRTVTADDLEDILGRHTSGRAGGGGFSDFFESLFGSGTPGASTTTTRRTASTSRKGRDVEQPIQVTVEEAFTGATRVIELTDDRTGKSKRIEVKLPAGVTDGSRVRIAGQGAQGVMGGQTGDLYLVVSMTPSPLFTRDGNDLRVKVPASLTTAMLGGEIQVPTPKGSKLALKIPAETQNGRVFRLRGQGMPKLGGKDERGDLFAEVQVQLPEKLTDRQRALFEELAKLESGAAAAV
jgi:DnaJ-class molecular chaperone